MTQATFTPQQAWNNLSEFWKDFSFMLVDGASSEQIAAFEKDQEVTLTNDVKELISIHSAVDIPSGIYGYYCAETALATIDKWERFDNSILNKQMDDPTFWPGVFKQYNCPSEDMKDYVVIGSDPWGADYGIYMMLHQASGTVFGIDWNIPEIKALGDMVTWVAQHRLGGYADTKAYVDNWNKNSDDPGGAGIAKNNRFYLNIGYPERLARWEKTEAQFIAAFDKIG